jgi:hypothetical protein
MFATRTWQFVMDETAKLKQGPTQDRWVRATPVDCPPEMPVFC